MVAFEAVNAASRYFPDSSREDFRTISYREEGVGESQNTKKARGQCVERYWEDKVQYKESVGDVPTNLL